MHMGKLSVWGSKEVKCIGVSVINIKLCVSICLQVSTEVAPLIQSDTQTFTIGVLPQIPGFPQLAPDCDLQITVRDKKIIIIMKDEEINVVICQIPSTIVYY